MQIDILSQNTLKLTLSRLDMFDLDIKYESLSGKNPETKRLLSHVLKSIQLDKRVGFDFSGERLFVEAFPRPDGGCMLYISSLENENFAKKQRKTSIPNEWAETESIFRERNPYNRKNPSKKKNQREYKIFETESLPCLKGLCNSLVRLRESRNLKFNSSLYNQGKKYRLIIESDNIELIKVVIPEYGLLFENELELINTSENFNEVKNGKAVEALAKCL